MALSHPYGTSQWKIWEVWWEDTSELAFSLHAFHIAGKRRNRKEPVHTLTLQVPPATNLANNEVGSRGGMENTKADRILKLETVLQ